ncbi:MAG: cytochrome c peroxidase [Planctomycetaceae bacterium]
MSIQLFQIDEGAAMAVDGVMKMGGVCLFSAVMAWASFGAPAVADDGAAETESVLLGSPALTSGIPGEGPLTNAEIEKWLADPANHRVLDVTLPLGLEAGSSQIVGLEESPLTRAKIELGRQLYFDPRLSKDHSVSCASCHHPDEGYSRQTRFGVGIDAQEGNRNSPISYNRILSSLQFWDGRAASLEEQAVGPIANPIEMGNTHDACVSTLKEIPGYVMQFDAIYGKDSLTIDHVGNAIAAFERALVTGPSAYDFNEEMRKYAELDADLLTDLLDSDEEFAARYAAAKAGAAERPMSESAQRGQELFFSERVNCAACHVGANLADEKYHNLGIGMDVAEPDVGRFAVTGKPEDWGAFKTPTVRNVAASGPYMHDGSLATLLDVVKHYDKGGTPNKNLSDKMRKLNLTEREMLDLVAFMEACTGDFPKVEAARLPE